MRIERWKPEERAAFIEMAHDFYHLPAVLHPVSDAHHARTFDAAMAGNPMIGGYFFYEGEQRIGYVLFAITWSNEAGGQCVWIEELYFLPEWQGKGYGHRFFERLTELYPDAARFRLECAPENPDAEELYWDVGFEGLPYHQMVLEKEREE